MKRTPSISSLCLWILLLGTLLAPCTNLFAVSLTIDGHAKQVRALQPWLDYYRDASGAMQLSDVKDNPALPWQAVKSSMIGISSDALWVRMNFDNSSGEVQDLILEDRWPQTDHLHFFLVQGDELLVEQKSGDAVELIHRSVPYRYPVFSFKVPVGQSMLFLRYQTSDLLSTRLYLSDGTAFSLTRETEKLLFGLLLGVILIMPLYNLMLFAVIKDTSYLYFAIFGLLSAGFQAAVHGLAFQYLADHAWLNTEVPLLLSFLSMFFVYRFLTIFLELRMRMPGVIKILGWFEKITLLAAGTCFLHLPTAIGLAIFAHLALIFWLFYTSMTLVWRHYRPAYFFLGASCFFLAGHASTVLSSFGLMEEGFFTHWGMLVGTAIEMVLVSIALGFKFAELRQALIVSEVEKSKLIGSMESARIIQESLVCKTALSEALDVASYYQSAEQTGGDWFSFMEHPDQDFAVFALGDVTGHGLSSSLMTAFACGAIEASFHNLQWRQKGMEHSLGKLAKTLNQLLFRTSISTDRLMTMCVFAIDLQEMKAYYVNCGHHASIHVSKNKIAPIFRRGSMLGLNDGCMEFSVLTFTFEVGDSLLLYSDGLVENSGPSGAMMAMHRVQKLLRHENRAGDNLQMLIEEAQKIWKATEAEDDVTVLIVRIDRASAHKDALSPAS